MRRVLLLGSTGSVGTSTLDVARQLRDRFQVAGLSARGSSARIVAQAREHGVTVVALEDEAAAEQARELARCDGVAPSP